MKKQWSIVFWVVVAGFVLVAAYTVYNKYSQDIQLKATPPSQAENTRSDESPDNGAADKGTSSNETNNQGTEEKIMVPDFELSDIDGNKVKLSDYKGKIVVINFWAVWCKYCREEMPDLERVHKKFAEEGNAVLLAVNVQEDLDTVKKYLSDNNLSLKVLMDYKGEVVGNEFFGPAVQGYPTTFIINSDGTLFGYIPGATNEKTLLDVVSKAK